MSAKSTDMNSKMSCLRLCTLTFLALAEKDSLPQKEEIINISMSSEKFAGAY